MEEDEKGMRDKRGGRQVRLVKEYNKRNLKVMIFLAICLCFFILNNIITYNNVNKLINENKQLKSNNVKPDIGEQSKSIHAKGVENQKNQFGEKLDKLLIEKEQLKKLNDELAEDNISLQNSLKIAAAVGIKPRNYEHPPQISSRSGIRKEQYLGKFRGTAYTPTKEECGNNRGITASGKPIIPGTTIAVDTRYWPIGTVFYIKGIGYVTAMDTGGAVKGKKRFDFAVFDRKFANALGTREWDVYLIKRGSGRVDVNFLKELSDN